jgi:hypothetical protein
LTASESHDHVVLTDGRTRLELTAVHDKMSTARLSLSVGQELQVQGAIDLGDRERGELSALMVEIQNEWRGWDGKKFWRSADNRLVLDVLHNGRSHVVFEVTCWSKGYQADWGATAKIFYEIGALKSLPIAR